MTHPADAQLREKLIDQLQSVHALKRGALRMFDPMLAAVARERDSDEMVEVNDLLARMHQRFSAHRNQTAAHVTIIESRLRAFDSVPARARVGAVSAGAAARARLGAIGGQNHGANARDAFVFEHLEIALLALLEQLADRCGDELTMSASRACREDDEGMAATINENWTNVLTLTLASAGLPTARPNTPTVPVKATA